MIPEMVSPKTSVEIGISGLRHDKYSVREEFLPKLQGVQGVKKLREMRDNSWAVGAFGWLMETLVRQVDWKVERPDDSAAAKKLEAIVDTARGDMEQTWSEIVSEVLSVATFGFAAHEPLYKICRGRDVADPTLRSKYDDGAVRWRNLAPRAQESLSASTPWIFDDSGRVVAMVQECEPDFRRRPIPIDKLLLFRLRSAKQNPEGRSLLRNAVRSWDFEKRIEEIEAIGIVRDLVGLLIARAPLEVLNPNASDEIKSLYADLKDKVRKIDRNEYEGAIFPAREDKEGLTGWDIELLKSGGSRQIDTDAIVRRYESRILITLLCEFLVLGMEKVHGSYALSDTKTNVFALALGAVLGSICDVFNDHAIPQLCMMNGANDPALYPRIMHGDIETPDLTQMGSFIAQVSPVGGVQMGKTVQRFLHEYAGLPPPAEDEEPIVPPANDEAPKPAPEADPAKPAPAAGSSGDAEAAKATSLERLNAAQMAEVFGAIKSVTIGEFEREATINAISSMALYPRDVVASWMPPPGFKPAVLTNTTTTAPAGAPPPSDKDPPPSDEEEAA